MDHMKVHFTPFYYLLAHLTHLVDHIVWFLFLHVLALATAGGFVWAYAFRITGSRFLAWLTGGLFVANPYTWSLNLNPHFEAFAVAGLAAFAYGVVARRRVLALVSLGLALTVKQDIWLYGLGVCFTTMGWRWRSSLLPAVMLILAYYLLAIKGYWHSTYEPINRLNAVWTFATSEWDILWFYTAEPQRIWQALTTTACLAFLGSLGFLPLAATWRCLPVLGTLLIWLSASDSSRSGLAYYYSYGILILAILCVPWAFVNIRSAAAVLARKIPAAGHKRWRTASYLVAVVALAATVIGLHLLRPSGLGMGPGIGSVLDLGRTPKHHHILKTMATLPRDRDISVFTQFSLGPYVPVNAKLHLSFNEGEALMAGTLAPDYVVLELTGFFYAGPSPRLINQYLATAAGQTYRLLAKDHDLYVYAKQ